MTQLTKKQQVRYLNAVSTGKQYTMEIAGRQESVTEYKGVRGATYYFNHCYSGPEFDVYNVDFKRIGTVSYGELI